MKKIVKKRAKNGTITIKEENVGIKAGDVVRLKSDRNRMTVGNIFDYGIARCYYTTDNWEIKSHDLPLAILEICEQ